MTAQRFDVYTQVTNNIIAAIEAGAGDWQMPWHRSGEGLNRPVNIDTAKSLPRHQRRQPLGRRPSPRIQHRHWGTYRQWQNKGCQVRKGEKSSLVVFYKEFDVEDRNDETGETEHGKRLMARASGCNADPVWRLRGAGASPSPSTPCRVMRRGGALRHRHRRHRPPRRHRAASYRPSDGPPSPDARAQRAPRHRRPAATESLLRHAACEARTLDGVHRAAAAIAAISAALRRPRLVHGGACGRPGRCLPCADLGGTPLPGSRTLQRRGKLVGRAEAD